MALLYWLLLMLAVTHSSGCGDGDDEGCAPEAAHSVLQKRTKRGVSSDSAASDGDSSGVAAADGDSSWDHWGNDLVGKSKMFDPYWCEPGKKCSCDGLIYFFHDEYYGPYYYEKKGGRNNDYHSQYWGPKNGFVQSPENKLRKIGSTWGQVWCDSRHFEIPRDGHKWRGHNWYETWGENKWGAQCQCWPKLCADENQNCNCPTGNVYLGAGEPSNHKGPRGNFNHGQKCTSGGCLKQNAPFQVKSITFTGWDNQYYHTGNVRCSFGDFHYPDNKDPAPGQQKRCWCLKVPTPRPTPRPPPPTPAPTPPTPKPTPAPTWPLSKRYCPCVVKWQKRYRVKWQGRHRCPSNEGRVGSYFWDAIKQYGTCEQWRKTGKCGGYKRSYEEHCWPMGWNPSYERGGKSWWGKTRANLCSNQKYFFENGTEVCPDHHTRGCSTPKWPKGC